MTLPPLPPRDVAAYDQAGAAARDAVARYTADYLDQAMRLDPQRATLRLAARLAGGLSAETIALIAATAIAQLTNPKGTP